MIYGTLLRLFRLNQSVENNIQETELLHNTTFY